MAEVTTRANKMKLYYDVQEALAADWPEKNKGMNMGLISYLLRKGYRPEDILECARYVRHERWVGVRDMRHIRNVIGSWITSGRPEAPMKPGEVVRQGRPEEYGLKGKKDFWTERIRRQRGDGGG